MCCTVPPEIRFTKTHVSVIGIDTVFLFCILSTLKVCVFSQDSQVRPNTTYSLHQPQGNKEHGTERSGYLYKKSDGWVLKINECGGKLQSSQISSDLDGLFFLTSLCFCIRLRKVWQKRKCTAKNGYLTISHGTVSKHTCSLTLMFSFTRGQRERDALTIYLLDIYHICGWLVLIWLQQLIHLKPLILLLLSCYSLSVSSHYLCRLTDRQLNSICSPVKWNTIQRRRGALT